MDRQDPVQHAALRREPLYARAERAAWWELTALASAGHPSVAAMARALLAGAPVVYNGDPLRDLSTSAFLDAFVQRKPKARPYPKSQSLCYWYPFMAAGQQGCQLALIRLCMVQHCGKLSIRICSGVLCCSA